MATVTGHRPNWITADELAAIETIAAGLGAPLREIFVTACTSRREQAEGKEGRVYLHLDDSAPGWRSKDNSAARHALKLRVREVLPWAAVYVQARYSCLEPQADGTIARRDDQGRVIGVHEV